MLEKVLPCLEDTGSVPSRQGAIETLACIHYMYMYIILSSIPQYSHQTGIQALARSKRLLVKCMLINNSGLISVLNLYDEHTCSCTCTCECSGQGLTYSYM